METRRLLQAADALERAAKATDPAEQRAADYEVLRHQEAIQVGLMQAEMAKFSDTPHALEALPLRAEGDDFGRVRRRMPACVFFHLMKQKNFGWDGMASDEGQRELDKAYPTTKVTTISGKTTVGWKPGMSREGAKGAKAGVRFGRGTLNLAT